MNYKPLPILLLGLLPFFSLAQTYTPMLGHTSSWVSQFIGFGIERAELTTAKTDTIISGETYHQLEVSNWLTTIGYLKEDSLERKVYLYEADVNGLILEHTEGVLYDFSLSIGDTAIIKSPLFDFRPSYHLFRTDTVILDSVKKEDPFLFGGYNWAPDSLTFYYLHNTSPVFSQSPIVWIEGIGSYIGVMFPTVEANAPTDLICYYRNGIHEVWRGFEFDQDTCYLKAIARGGDIGIDKNEITPFPFDFFQESDQITISQEESRKEGLVVKVFDTNGREVYGKIWEIQADRISINVENVPTGIYYLSVFGENSQYHRSFVKW